MGLLYDLFGIPTQKMVECAVKGHKFIPMAINFNVESFRRYFKIKFTCRDCQMQKEIMVDPDDPIIIFHRAAEVCEKNPKLQGDFWMYFNDKEQLNGSDKE